MRKNRQNNKAYRNIENYKTTKSKKSRKAANIFKQMEHVKKNMSKDRRQQKHRCTMMREKQK